MKNAAVSPWRSPFGLAGAFLTAVPFPARTALIPSPAWCCQSPPWPSQQEPGHSPMSNGAVGTPRHPRCCLSPWSAPLDWLESPQGSSSTGPGPHAVPNRVQMGIQEGSGCSTDRSWGHRAASPGHSEKGGCETRAGDMGPAWRQESAGKFGVTTGAKLGWPREGESCRGGDV